MVSALASSWLRLRRGPPAAAASAAVSGMLKVFVRDCDLLQREEGNGSRGEEQAINLMQLTSHEMATRTWAWN